MRHMKLFRLTALLALAGALIGCSTVNLDQPEVVLPVRFSDGADIRLVAFEGSSGWSIPTEGLH